MIVKTAGAGLLAAGLLLVTPALAQTPYFELRTEPAGVSVCPQGLCQSAALGRWFESVSTGPTTILQIGDSHTAGGRITDGAQNALRLRLRLGQSVTFILQGQVGATLAALAARDDVSLLADITASRPALIVLAYGTNEGFDDGLSAQQYEALLRGQVDRLRRLAPDAPLLILGAPDAQRNGVTNGCSADRLRAPPPNLAVVRDVQRRVAADMGVAFWDWHGRMGGDCSADRLALRGEPLMRGDRVHFTSAGADWIGGVLAADLLTAFDAWKAARTTPVEASE